MPTIRVDDEVFRVLQKKGQAFVDTPNTVLRRILGLTKSGRRTIDPRPRFKSISRSRQAGVQDWIINGKRLGARQVSKMLAAVYNEKNPDKVYEGDSPERFLDKHLTEIANMAQVEAIVDGQAVSLEQFVKNYPAVVRLRSTR